MRVILEPIVVDVCDGSPVVVRWNQSAFQVLHIVDTWTWRGRWWQGDSRRRYYVLDCVEGTLEVYTDGSAWTLSRLMD